MIYFIPRESEAGLKRHVRCAKGIDFKTAEVSARGEGVVSRRKKFMPSRRRLVFQSSMIFKMFGDKFRASCYFSGADTFPLGETLNRERSVSLE